MRESAPGSAPPVVVVVVVVVVIVVVVVVGGDNQRMLRLCFRVSELSDTRSWTTYNLSRGKVAPHLSGPRLINLEGGAHSIVLTCDHPIETSTIGFVVIL